MVIAPQQIQKYVLRRRGLSPLLLLMVLLLVGCGSLRRDMPAVVGPTAAQRDAAMRKVATNRVRFFQCIAARIRTDTDTAFAWRQLDTLLESPSGDMFWTYPATAFYFYCRDLLSEQWRGRFRATLGRFTPYRGDTENHFLMHYTFLLLFSQEWPDMTAREWFNGKSSAENHAEATAYLEHWIDETSRRGITEWDSPRYFYYYLTPLLTLRDFARDEGLRKRAGMILESLFADFATAYLAGNYCGPHSRDGDGSVINPRTSEATSVAGFYFEDSLSFVLPDLAFAAMSPWQIPSIIRDVAHCRDSSFVQTERQRSRAKMRYSGEVFTPVHIYNFMTRDYALGSMQGGLQEPIQQHSWDVTFAATGANNTIFGLNPHASAVELGTFFPEEPELMQTSILQSKASYGNENKWIGGSPYERIAQYRNVLVAYYDIPEGVRFPHVDLYLPKSLDTLIRDVNGWTIARMGDAFVALRVIASRPVEWIDEPTNMRLRSNDPKTRYIVDCSRSAEMPFEAFVSLFQTGGRRTKYVDTPVELRYHSTSGDIVQVRIDHPGGDLSIRHLGVDNQRASDTVETNRSDWLYNGPFLQSRIGSGVIEIRCNGRMRRLDFPNGIVTE